MNYSPSYRPDIDGLRAVAITAVVGFHAFPGVIRGGYVGVDVFFVISGYLITSLILGGLAKGTFSFTDFYIRRIKRIFPALALVLSTCLPLGWLWLMPGEFADLGKHIASGAAFVTNIVQWHEAGYFDLSAQYKPLLHLWLLGIEEQFYLGCPLITMIAWRYGRIFSTGIIIVLASFAVNIAFVHAHSIAVFYLPFSRSWELVLGSCLATLPQAVGRLSALNSKPLRDVASFAGAGLIFAAIVMFDASTSFPGWRALLPTIGTVLILWSGQTAWLNRKLLAHPAPVYVGLISYPIYLWHWPLLSFLAIADASTPLLRVIVVALTIALSWATYRFLEIPVRHSRRPVWIPLATSLGLIAVFAGAVYTAAFPAKSSSSGPPLAAIEKAASDWVYPIGTPLAFKDQTFYRDGIAPNPVLFIGDSNMEQYSVRIHDVINRSGNMISAIFATYGGCNPIPGISAPKRPACQLFASQSYEFTKSRHFSAVVIAAQWDGYFTSGDYRFDEHPLNTKPGRSGALASLKSEIQALVKSGTKVYLVLNIPIGDEFDPKSRVLRTFNGIQVLPPRQIERSVLNFKYGSITDDLTRVGEETGATVINPVDWLCDKQFCKSTDDDGAPMYKDGYHLRASFVRVRVDYLDSILDGKSKAAASSISER